MILLDTNLLIEILKGNASICEQAGSLEGPLALSSISAMELFYGALDKAELLKLNRFVDQFQNLHITEAISVRATLLVKTYAKSHGLDIPDALIAATALDFDAHFWTLNLKDFRFIPGLELVASTKPGSS